MKKITFKNLPDKTTPISANNLNQLQNNVDEAILNPVVESIECKNKFDMNGNILESIGYTSGTNILESGKIKSTANMANGNGKGQIIQLKPNTVYTYSVKIGSFEVEGSTCLRISPVNSEGNAVGYLVDQSITCEVGKVYSYSFTTSSTGKIWVMLNGISNVVDYSILKYVVYDYVQINDGSTAEAYTPYKKYGYNSQESMGSIVVDDIRSKNLFNYHNTIDNNYINSADEVSYDEGCCYGADLIEVEPNTQYTISSSVLTLLIINEYTSAKVNQPSLYHFNNKTGLSHTITTGSNTRCVRISTNKNDKDKVQFELGSAVTNYSEYRGIGYTSGQNANGHWIKYDDGRLECWGKASIPANQTNTTITFPIPFLEPNKYGLGTNINISITDIYTNSYYNVYIVAEFTNNNFKVFAFTASGGTPTVQRDFFFNVKGFWK